MNIVTVYKKIEEVTTTWVSLIERKYPMKAPAIKWIRSTTISSVKFILFMDNKLIGGQLNLLWVGIRYSFNNFSGFKV